MKLFTKLLIPLTFAVWIVWDIIAAQNGGPTESQVILGWSKKSVCFPHLIGFLCGHWFFPRRGQWKSGWMWAIPIWVSLGLLDVLWNLDTIPWSWMGSWGDYLRFPLWWLLLGIATGTLLWNQGDPESPIP